jgi:hypothetical protein
MVAVLLRFGYALLVRHSVYSQNGTTPSLVSAFSGFFEKANHMV